VNQGYRGHQKGVSGLGNADVGYVNKIGRRAMKRFVTAFAAGALLVSPLAFAGEEHFNAADADASGSLSAEEATAAGIAEDAFGTADADADGSLTMEEYEAAVEAGTITES
jgi:hypothetical protein